MIVLTPALVVVVNSQLDWQRVVNEGWYRIPLKHAPHPVAAGYLAFYFTRRFGENAWQVRYYAPIRQYQRVRRRELLPAEPAHPRADEWYYRVEVGPLLALADPLRSRRLRRIAFIPTTLERLQTAADVADLWATNDESAVLWTHFRDAALKATKQLSVEERPAIYGSRAHSSPGYLAV